MTYPHPGSFWTLDERIVGCQGGDYFATTILTAQSFAQGVTVICSYDIDGSMLTLQFS